MPRSPPTMVNGQPDARDAQNQIAADDEGVAPTAARRRGDGDVSRMRWRSEYAVGSRVVQRHDFLEGVRAVIVDKDNATAMGSRRRPRG